MPYSRATNGPHARSDRQFPGPGRLTSFFISQRNKSIASFIIYPKEGVGYMALQFGLLVPQGWRMDLVGIADPLEAYETMTRVAQEAEALGYDSIWLFDHF